MHENQSKPYELRQRELKQRDMKRSIWRKASIASLQLILKICFEFYDCLFKKKNK